MNKKVRKIFVVGNQTGYASWMEGQLVNTMEEADLVVFTGGEDINPVLYGEGPHPYTSFNPRRDDMEMAAMAKAINLNKYIWGTCRGAQLMCSYNRGRVIQHVNHPSFHKFSMVDTNIEYDVTSCHHQMLFTNSCVVPTHVLGFTKQLSPFHLDGRNHDIGGSMTTKSINGELFIAEPEIVYFASMYTKSGSTRSTGLCIQGHPEWMDTSRDKGSIATMTMLKGLLDKWMNPDIPDLSVEFGIVGRRPHVLNNQFGAHLELARSQFHHLLPDEAHEINPMIQL